MQETYSNDYSLLRPFDLEVAKRGEPLTTSWDHSKGKPVWKYTAGPDSAGDIVVTNIERGSFDIAAPSCFAMAPLAWVEGKPVYKGDVLWYKDSSLIFSVVVEGYNPNVSDNSGLIGTILEVTNNNSCVYKEGKITWAPWNMFVWPKQKVKKQIWINVYPEESFTSYPSKGLADSYADTHARIACVPVEIEYEVE